MCHSELALFFFFAFVDFFEKFFWNVSIFIFPIFKPWPNFGWSCDVWPLFGIQLPFSALFSALFSTQWTLPDYRVRQKYWVGKVLELVEFFRTVLLLFFPILFPSNTFPTQYISHPILFPLNTFCQYFSRHFFPPLFRTTLMFLFIIIIIIYYYYYYYYHYYYI